MAENQGPWWTRPPSPSRPSTAPEDGPQGPPTPGELPEVLDLRDRPRRSRRAQRVDTNPFGVDAYGTDPLSDGHVDAGAPTEQLPPVPDGSRTRSGDQGYDALGVYGTPTAVAPGIPGLSADADPVDHLRDPARPRLRVPDVPWRELPRRVPVDRFRQVKWRELPWQRVPWKPVTAAAVVLFIVVTLVRLVVGDEESASQASQSAGAQGSPTQAAGEPKDLAQVPAADAEEDLREVDQSRGDVQDAWGWTDENGRNLFATTSERVGDDVTLRVVHAAGLDGDARALRVMTDPGLPGCRGEGTAGFVKESAQVRDLNRDGVAEAMIGWVARCGGKAEESRVKLALVSDGKKYIIRGEGVIGGSGSRVPDPAADQWPKGFLKATTQLYQKLYF